MRMGRPRAFDIDQALDQAMRVFWRLGYEGASLAELTKAMGINSPSLYAAFGSKESLFKAVLDRYAALREQAVSAALAASSAREAAERLLMSQIDLATDPDQPPGCLLLQGGLTCGVATQEIPQELARRRADLEETLRQRFKQAQKTGDLPPSADPGALSRYIVTLCNGIAIQAASGASRDELKQTALLALKAWPA